jgi:hypothetical protein
MTVGATPPTPQDRAQQLESVRDFISLKTYNAIAEKLAAEAVRLAADSTARTAKAAHDSAPQVLPRDVFEERHMPRRVIRID